MILLIPVGIFNKPELINLSIEFNNLNGKLKKDLSGLNKLRKLIVLITLMLL